MKSEMDAGRKFLSLAFEFVGGEGTDDRQQLLSLY